MTTSIREEDLDTANTAEESREGQSEARSSWSEPEHAGRPRALSHRLSLNTLLAVCAVVIWSLVAFLGWR